MARKKFTPLNRIVIAAIISITWLFLTNGEAPKNISGQTILIDYEMRYIFQTALVETTKTYRRKIENKRQGILGYIPLIGKQKWVEIEIQVTTKYGFNLIQQSSTGIVRYDSLEDKYILQTNQIGILDRKIQTKIIQKQDSFMHAWDLQDFDQQKNYVVQQLLERQSQLELQKIKEDESQISTYIQLFQQKLKNQENKKLIYPSTWLLRLNRFAYRLFLKIEKYLRSKLALEQVQKVTVTKENIQSKDLFKKNSTKSSTLVKQDKTIDQNVKTATGSQKMIEDINQKFKENQRIIHAIEFQEDSSQQNEVEYKVQKNEIDNRRQMMRDKLLGKKKKNAQL